VISMGSTWTAGGLWTRRGVVDTQGDCGHAGGLWTHSDKVPTCTPAPKEPNELKRNHGGGASSQSAQHVFWFCLLETLQHTK
jgi:hypothetical protein